MVMQVFPAGSWQTNTESGCYQVLGNWYREQNYAEAYEYLRTRNNRYVLHNRVAANVHVMTAN